MDHVIRVGDQAPDFRLSGIPEDSYSLSDFRGSIVVLAFYPADSSPVCTTQLRSYTLDQESFKGLNAVVLGISPQSVESHRSFAGEKSIGVPLLSDEKKEVAEMYGVPGPLGFYRRSVFVVDTQGIIVYARRSTAGLSFVPASVLLEVVASAH